MTLAGQETITRLISAHYYSLLRLAFAYTGNEAEAEDVVQDVFLSLVSREVSFESEAHEKAWLIRCTINRSKNVMKSAWLRKRAPLEEAFGILAQEDRGLLSAVLALPENYRAAIHLHYYENYSIQEIAVILGRKPATVGTWLARGRERLRNTLKGGLDDE